MAEDGRLELDDDGHVVGSSHVLDLSDPTATEQLPPTRAHALVDRSVAPWVRRHRTAVASTAAVAVALALGASWWTHRPTPVEPPDPIAIENAVLDGRDLGGPRIRDDGYLMVALAVRSTDPGTTYEVVGFDGPSLATTVVKADRRAAAGEPARVQVEGVLQCSDARYVTARPSDFALQVRRTDSQGSRIERVPLGADVTPLDIAVRNHCVEAYAAPALQIVDTTVVGQAGTTVASLGLVVRNVSSTPIEVATSRRTNGDVLVDLSPTVVIAPQRAAIVSSRLLVTDCTSTPRTEAVLDMPHPTLGAGYLDPTALAGVTLRVGQGDAHLLASYPLTTTVADLGARLRATACRTPPSVTTRLVSASGRSAADGSWLVTGEFAFRTTGIGVTVGREQFDGPAWGAGSVLATSGELGTRWSWSPARLDGGAGRVVLTFTGASCRDATDTVPSSLPVRVTTADRVAYPFELPVDSAALRKAVSTACAVT